MSAFQGKYAEELVKNAKYLGSTSGKGILAADENTRTIGRRFAVINVDNTESNRLAYRQLLLTTPGALQYLTGVLLVEETLYQNTADGKPFTDLLRLAGVLPGIKLDMDIIDLPGTSNGETTTQGLDDLRARCQKYYDAGARFAKWRAFLTIGPTEPSELAIQQNAHDLARYAIICQENGLVPLVEPEVLTDGDHDIHKCAAITEKVLAAVYKALNDHHVLLEGTLLMANMVTPGYDSPKASPEQVAESSIRALRRTVPAAVPGILFLSGRQSEDDSTLNLNAINSVGCCCLGQVAPWGLSFCFGGALQQSAIKTWKGMEENVEAAREAFLTRCKANSLATIGKYAGGAKGGLSSESWWWW